MYINERRYSMLIRNIGCVSAFKTRIIRKKDCFQHSKISPNFVALTPPSKLSSYLNKFLFDANPEINLKSIDGSKVPASIIKDTSTNWHLRCYGECVGNIWVSKCSAPILGDLIPDDYINKGYLYINHLSSDKKYKGIGTELVKAAVRESYKKG